MPEPGPDSESAIGLPVEQLDTPALLVDLDALDHNAELMASRCREAGLAWRPHVKACKTPRMAQRLLDAGAVGVTCAKVSEAEDMAAGGIQDILIANEVVGEFKAARAARLAREITLSVAADSEVNLRQLSAAAEAAGSAIDVLIDIDVGLHRCGVTPEDAPALAQLTLDLPSLNLRGLMGYEGHVMHLDPEAKERETAASASILARARHACEATGIRIAQASGGGSGNYRFVLQHDPAEAWTELQAGGAVLMDLTYEEMGVQGHLRALAIVAQLVSVANYPLVAADAGWKTTGRHTGLPAVVPPRGMECRGLSAEHTHLEVDEWRQVEVGERIRLVPHYSDSTILLHRQIHAHRRGIVEEVWPISAAGALQ